jgi:hypothetical protein
MYSKFIKIDVFFKQFLVEKPRRFLALCKKRFVGIEYFVSRGDRLVYPDNDMDFFLISNPQDFDFFCSKYSLNIKKNQFDRFAEGDKFFCLIDGENWLSYGWASRKSVFFVSEIGKPISNFNTLMFYDFFTNAQNRNKGYYSNLLKIMGRYYSEKQLAIFALKSNKPSLRAIEKVGFQKSEYVTLK